MDVSAQVGFLGSNLDKVKPHNTTFNDIKTGFFGNEFNQEKNIRDPFYITPVGVFHEYIGKKLIFPTNKNLDTGVGCKNTQINGSIYQEQKNNDFTDFFELSFHILGEKYSDKFILVRNYPHYEEFSFSSEDEMFFQYDLENNESYSYTLFVDNNCGRRKISKDYIFQYEYKYNLGLKNDLWDSLAPIQQKKLSYENASLLFLNTLGKQKITDKKTSFKLLQYFGIFSKNIQSSEKISKQEFLRIYAILTNRNDFQKDIEENIDIVFQKTNEEKAREILSFYYKDLNLETALLKANNENIDLLIQNKKIIDNSWENFVNILYSLYMKDQYISGEIGIKSYRKIIDEYQKEVFSGEKPKNMGFFDYERMKLLIGESNLKEKLLKK